MTSDRMIQAIGRIERAISRLETTVEKVRSQPRSKPPQGDPALVDPFSHDKAVAALRSLDALIDDIQKAQRNG